MGGNLNERAVREGVSQRQYISVVLVITGNDEGTEGVEHVHVHAA